jgi:glycosyltransferase involved in cell wall biosynthesis
MSDAAVRGTGAPLLIAAVIVRDEAGHLDRCLTSLAGLVDGMVVVDTGSTDDTVAVARRHGAIVDHVAWTGDFATPRNRSLDLVDGDWVLYVDADEEVVSPDPEPFRAQLAGADDHIAFRVQFIPRVGWTPYREYRVWRSRPSIRFEGVIHETMVPAIHGCAEREGRIVGISDLLTIQHHGYEGDQRRKHSRDEPLLLEQLAHDPDRIFLYDHLARIYEAQGDSARAVATWMRGINQVRRHAAVSADDRLVYIDLIFHRIAAGDTGDDVGRLVAEALERFPGVPTLEYAAAVVDFDRGEAGRAAARVERVLGLSLDEVMATGSSYDSRLFGEWAWNLLGLCRFALGEDAAAAVAFQRAEREAPGDLGYRTRRQLAETRAARRAP